jgi:multidrug efflux pump subunit AcrB
MLVGLFLVPQLPVKLNPSRRIPVVNISFTMRGHSAQVVEAEVTSKLEGMLGRVKGVRTISSYSSNGAGRITIRLSEHVEPAMARFEISTVVRQAWSSLPQGVSYPRIYMSGTSEEVNRPFLHYTINAPFTPIQIQEYVSDNIKPKIAELKGVDKVEVTGASRMIYRLDYSYELLQRLQVSVADIQTAIKSCLAQEFFGMGKVLDNGGGEQWIRVALAPESRSQSFDPSQIPVKNSNGTVIYLDQLVKTSYVEEEVSSAFRINGLNSIYLSVAANDDANQLALSKQIQALLAAYKENLPEGYELHLSYDAGAYIQKEMDKIYFRSGLTVLILLCFVLLIYRSWRYSLLIVFSLVANIAIAAIFYYLLRIEMQLYSLAGLTISLTLIIDNTIIMSDQIIRRANKKAFLAILAATLTSIGALTIILFMDEKVRANLQDFALIIIVNLSVSLFVAWILVPALIEKLNITNRRVRLRSPTFAKPYYLIRIFNKVIRFGRKRWLVYFNRIYVVILYFMCRRKKWFITLLILAFGLPTFLLPEKLEQKDSKTDDFSLKENWVKWYNLSLGSEVYKESVKPIVDVALGGTLRLFAKKVSSGSYASGERSETTLNVTASLPNGSTKNQMDNLVQKMESYIRRYPEVRQQETYIQSGQRASITIFFVEEHQRSSFPYLLKSRLIGKALELGGGSWSVYGLGDGFNNDVKEQAGSCRIRLLGYNYEELQALAQAMQDSLLQHRRIKEVAIDSKFSWYKNDYTEYVVDLSREQLAQAAVLPTNLFNSMKPLFEKSVSVADWLQGARTESIQLFATQADELDIWNVESYPGQANGRSFKLSAIAGVDKWMSPQGIAKENQQYLLCIQYEYIGAYAQSEKVQMRYIDAFNRDAPLGYKAEVGSSQYGWSSKSSSQYWLLLLIAAIIFFTTGILFSSLTQPLVVIFTIPISFIGLFLTFYLFNLSFDQGGFAAFVLLSGITVNANIYVLNEYNNIRARRPQLSPIKAYLKAWNAKVSPIFLTIASTILGFIPFMLGAYKEAFWFPLAAGTIGGLVVSFMALVFFLPMFMNVVNSE